MYTYSPSKNGLDTLTEHRSIIQENNSYRNYNKTKKILIGALVFFSIVAVFTGGYLLRHYVELETINNWLGYTKDECKNITARQIDHANSTNYIT